MQQQFRSTVDLFVVSVLFLAAAKCSAQDVITDFLNKRGLSNIPPSAQVTAKPGGYAAYDTRYKDSPPNWLGPVNNENPQITIVADPVVIPGETVTRAKGLSVELQLFGYSPALSLKSQGTLTYGDLELTAKTVGDANSVYALLTDGSPLDQELKEFGNNGNPKVWANQHLFIVQTVYYAKKISIHSTKNIEFKAASDGNLPACSDAEPVVADQNAGATANAKHVTAANGGGGSFCSKSTGIVEFYTEKPIPVAAQLQKVIVEDNGKWNLVQTVVRLDGTKTVEFKGHA